MYGGMCHKIDKALAMLFFLLILKTLIVQEMMSDRFLISQRVYCKIIIVFLHFKIDKM